MPKSRSRLTFIQRVIKALRRAPAQLPSGGHTMGKLIVHKTTPVSKELREQRAKYNPKRGKPELIWDSGSKGTFVGSIRSTFTGARRNNKVAKAA